VILVLSVLNSSFGQNSSMAKHVIIIGVDGMSPDGVRKAETPNMDNLMKNGAYTLHARGVLPTVSTPNWASMIMGAGPEQHGMTSNDWERDEFSIPAVTTGSENLFPSIFTILHEQKPGAEIGVINHWDGFARLVDHSSVNYIKHGETEVETAQLASDYIKSKKPVLTFVHLDHVDGAGHHYGHGSPEYYKSVEIADLLIGTIIQAAKDAGIYEDAVIIVSADHGGLGYGHGGESLEELEIPFIIAGKNVKKGYEMKTPVYQYDNAATVAYILGLQQPHAWIGKPILFAFEGNEEPENYHVRFSVEKPEFTPGKNLYSPAGGLFINTNASFEIKSSGGAEIRYTMDGTEPSKSSQLYSGPVPVNNSSVIRAKSFKGNEESLSASAYFRILKDTVKNGLAYKYYEGEKWGFLPAFADLDPVKTGRVYEFRIDNIKHREDQYAVTYDGYIKIDKEGDYTFYTFSDDGSILYIDGKEIVNNDGSHGTKEKSGGVKLKPGFVPIRVAYFNDHGGAWLDVYYKGPGVPKQIVPADKLYLSNN
jgi:hypothetical protein